MRGLFSDTVQIWLRASRLALRQPVWVLSNLLEPVVWLFLFGQMYGSLARLPGFPTASYLEYFAPGVVTMTALFGSAWSGLGLITDIQRGTLDRLLATPAHRLALILGRVLHTGLTVAVQCLIILLVAGLMGAPTATGAPGALGVAFVAGLFGTGLSALSHALAVLVPREDPLAALVNFLSLPVIFVSTAMVPANFLPPWMQAVVRYNPVDWAVEAVRTLMLDGWVWNVLARDVLLLALLTALFNLAAVCAFNTRTR
ncbi:MAG: ABC transporter permease [Bacillota bacterium]